MSKKQPRVPGTKVRPRPLHKRLCVIVGDESDPVVAVQMHEHLKSGRSSGLLLFTSSAPSTPDDATDDDFGTYCLACTSKRHPEAERGLTLARAYGSAWWSEDEGEWIAHDEDGNEVVFASGDEPTGDEETAEREGR